MDDLCKAAEVGDKERVLSLIKDRKIDVNGKNEFGQTPLWLASCFGQKQVAECLIQHEASVNLAKTRNRSTPLLVASQQGHSHVVKLLISSGADVNATTDLGTTALINASGKGHFDVVSTLIRSGASVNARNDKGTSPLWLAALEGRKKVVDYLIQNGADVNIVLNKEKTTPLFVASQEGHLCIASLLLSRGADVNLPSENGDTALIMASLNGHMNVVIFLLKKKAFINEVNKNGKTAFHEAALKGHREVVEILLDNGVEVERRDNNGRTAWELADRAGNTETGNTILLWKYKLCRAVAANNLKLVESLLGSGSDINERDVVYLDTPLHWAAKLGHVLVVQLLLENGADYKRRNSAKKTASELAKMNGELEVRGAIKLWASKTPAERQLEVIVAKVSRHLKELKDFNRIDKNVMILKDQDESMANAIEKAPDFFEFTGNEENKSGFLAENYIENLIRQVQSQNVTSIPHFIKPISDFASELESLTGEGKDVDTKEAEIKSLELKVENNELITRKLLSKIDHLNESEENAAKTKLEIEDLKSKEKTYVLEIERLKNEIDIKRSTIFKNYNSIIVNSNCIAPPITVNLDSRRNPLSSKISSLRDRIFKRVVTNRSNQLSVISSTVSTASEIKSLLQEVANRGHEFDLLELLRTGCDVNTRFECGHTALHLACKYNSVDVVRTLIEAKADIEADNKRLATPLSVAAEEGRLEVVELLLEYKTNVNSTMDNGISPLYLAVKNGHAAIAELLLGKGADVNLCSAKKGTPLHRAAQHGSEEVTRLLLRNGADINALNDQNETPSVIAQRHFNFRCRELILGWPIDGSTKAATSIAIESSSATVRNVGYLESHAQTVIETSGDVLINTGQIFGALKGNVNEVKCNIYEKD